MKNCAKLFRSFLLVMMSSMLFACSFSTQTFSPKTIYYDRATESPLATEKDSIVVLVNAFNPYEIPETFDTDLLSRNILPYVISITNRSSFPLTFDPSTFPGYIEPDEVRMLTKTPVIEPILGGVIASFLMPIGIYLSADPESENRDWLLSPAAFKISAAIFGALALGQSLKNAENNAKRGSFFRLISDVQLVIPPGEDDKIVVFQRLPLVPPPTTDSLENVPAGIPIIVQKGNAETVKIYAIPFTH